MCDGLPSLFYFADFVTAFHTFATLNYTRYSALLQNRCNCIARGQLVGRTDNVVTVIECYRITSREGFQGRERLDFCRRLFQLCRFIFDAGVC